MSWVLFVLFMAVGGLLLALSRGGRWAWTLAGAALLGGIQGLGGAGGSGLWKGVWGAFGSLALVIHVPSWRRRLLVAPLFARFRRMLPPLSRTEREALEAGTVWWDGELFSGRPAWDKLLATAPPLLSPGEQAFLEGPVEELCGLLEDWRIVEEHRDLPPEVWRFLKDKGFFGMIIPREYGGLGFSALAHSQVVLKLASRSCTAVVTVMVPNSLGPAELLIHYGTQAQKSHYLPRLARGQEIPCFALTGPDAGSDAASIPDTGVVCRRLREGRETLGIRLDWEKRYITLGPVATLLGLAFRLRDPEGQLPEGGEGITLALIPVDTPGITLGSRHDPMGIPFQVGPTWGRDVFIPLEAIIGGPAGAGCGWRMLMECLAAGRSLSLPALSTGACKLAALVAGDHGRIRKQFRMPIGRFEGVEEALARIAGNTHLVDAARTLTCGALDQGARPSVVSAIVKYQCTERMRRVLNDAMDVLGGSGVCLGPRNLLGRAYQAIPISITVEGANILTRSLILFGQGVIRCHPHVLEEMRALSAEDPREGLRAFDRHLGAHLAHTLSCGVRALLLGLSGGRPAGGAPGPARRCRGAVNRFSAAFAFAADLSLLTLGGSLKRRERLSGRMADILSHLYLLSAALKQFEDRGRPAGELPLLEWACEHSLQAIEAAFAGLFRNFPSPFLGRILRLVILPLGRRAWGPGDGLSHRVAALLLEPSPVRDRLTAGVFLPLDPQEPLGRLEDGLRKVLAAEPVERKLWKGVAEGRIAAGPDAQMLAQGLRSGLLSPEEGKLMSLALDSRRETSAVDHFPRIPQVKE